MGGTFFFSRVEWNRINSPCLPSMWLKSHFSLLKNQFNEHRNVPLQLILLTISNLNNNESINSLKLNHNSKLAIRFRKIYNSKETIKNKSRDSQVYTDKYTYRYIYINVPIWIQFFFWDALWRKSYRKLNIEQNKNDIENKSATGNTKTMCEMQPHFTTKWPPMTSYTSLTDKDKQKYVCNYVYHFENTKHR